MTLLADTSVWSLALRRDASVAEPEVHELKDALLAQLCMRHDVVLLSTDNDFALAAKHCPLRI